MNEQIPGNVGVLDEVIRYALIVAIVIAAGVALTKLGSDWLLFIILPAGLSVGYLLLTSAAHEDLLFMILGVDTRHHKRKGAR